MLVTKSGMTSGVGSSATCGYKSGELMKEKKASPRDVAAFSEAAHNRARSDSRARSEITSDTAASTAAANEPTGGSGDEKTSISEMIKEQTEKLESMFSVAEDNRAGDTRLMSIKSKLYGGFTLSAEDEAYLSQKDPDSYSNYRITQNARKQFRYGLSCCRTKDEVNGMRLANALSALAAYKKAARNGGGTSALAGLNMALEREISDFAKTRRYNSLPTSAERDKYYMELAKARKYEREKRAAKLLNASKKKKKQIKQPGDGKRTVAQVENSPLGRKVRAAQRRGGCDGFSSSYGLFGGKLTGYSNLK